MKITKKLMAAMLAVTMLLCSAGCGGTEQSLSDGGASSSAQPVESTAQGDTGSDANSTASTTSASATATTSASTQGTSGSTAASTQGTTASTTASAASTTAVAEPSESVPDSTDISVTYTISNTWQESGMCCTQIEFVISNNSSGAVSGWSVQASTGQNTEVMQCWNCTMQAGGSGITATNAEYNAEIPCGGQTSFGCIIKTPAEISTIGAVTVNGKVASATGGSSGSGGNSTTTAATTSAAPAPTEIEYTGKYGLVSDIGQLSVKGAQLVGADGEAVQLRGVSTHGMQWFPAFANKDIFKYLRDEWNVNCIRLAMYTGESEGYTNSTKAGIEQNVQNAIDACIQLDMYVIVDWHLLADQSPQVRKADALRFFGYISEKYGSYPNIIYEICNEPNGYATWSGDVKPYAEEIIPVIRANDPDSLVLVGTPTWSQDIDKALADPLKFGNVMYTLHYYANTHTDWLRSRLKSCHDSGLPIFVSEFSNCDASGDGYNNITEATKWLQLLDSLGISYINWSLCDKSESASLLAPGASTTGGWTDAQLTESGRFIRDWFKNHG